MTTEAFWAIVALIWLACCTAMWRANEAVKRQDRERVAEVTRPRPNIIPDRGWHATNYEGGHHPEARENKAKTGYLARCTCPFRCLEADPRNDRIWPTYMEAYASAEVQLRERGAR